MTAAENIRAQLEYLREHGSMARSQCSGALLKTIRPMMEAGVMAEERSGAGRRIVVRDLQTFADFCRRRFPDAAIPSEAASRVAGVARFRNSKSLRNDAPEIVCVRGAALDVLRRNGEPVDIAQATRMHHVFAFALEPESGYSLHGPCAVVENPAVFFAFEKLRLPVELAIHGRGRCSGRLLDWLAGQADPHFCVWHLPDYDPTGLSEFSRLCLRLGRRARLYRPANLDELFERFSKRELLANPGAQRLLRELRDNDSPEVRKVVSLIDQHNAGLEQESLLIP